MPAGAKREFCVAPQSWQERAPAAKPAVEEKALWDEDAEKIEGYFTEADISSKG